MCAMCAPCWRADRGRIADWAGATASRIIRRAAAATNPGVRDATLIMHPIRRTPMVLRILAFVFLFAATPAFACRCVMPSGTDAQRAGNGFVEHALVGVMEVTGVDKSGVVAGRHQNNLIELTLRERFKGSWLRNRPYLASNNAGTCGVTVHTGQLWLVYANDSAALGLMQCGLSAPLLGRLGHIGTLFELRERAEARAEARRPPNQP
jgi:hypothetical protein